MIRVGDILCDNDPRSRGALVRVVEACEPIAGARLVIQGLVGGPKRRLLASRVYEDGKARRTGYTVVERADGETK